MNFLKNHPFAVEAFFENSTVLTFAAPKESLLRFIPNCLQLDTFDDKWGFIAVAMVQTKHLRPKGFPKFLGNNFFLIGYRIFVRYTNSNGKKYRGLYILKSETDKYRMKWMGNIFTHYRYSKTDINIQETREAKIIKSIQSKFEIKIAPSIEQNTLLPKFSPFSNWNEARKYAGPLPHTFTLLKPTNSMLIIEGIRQNWKPQPITVANYHFEFIDHLNIKDLVLANAFEINHIPYYWKKGRIE